MRSFSRASWLSSAIGSVAILLSVAQPAVALTNEEWRDRILYQVMTDRFARTDGSITAPCNTTEGINCGGTYKGLINKLDYIQGMGFDSIMISPISEQISSMTHYGTAYHGYWPTDFYNVNSNFGTQQDIIDLSDALHARGMYLMVDIVIGDMAYNLNGDDIDTVDYSKLIPFNNEDNYHAYCPVDYSNVTSEEFCNLGDKYVSLLDLDTESTDVINTMVSWTQEMVKNYTVDGLRIDAAKHVDPPYLKNITSSVDIYSVGEVFEADPVNNCKYQPYVAGVTNYPVYYGMLYAFTAGNISYLANQIAEMPGYCLDTTLLLSFSENHDLARFASFTNDTALAKNNIAFTLLQDGIPIIYQGQEQHFSGGDSPACREAVWLSGFDTTFWGYEFVTKVNQIRRQAINTDPEYVTTHAYSPYTDSSSIVMRKGNEGRQVVAVFSSNGENGAPYNLTLPTAFESGLQVTEIIECTNQTVSDDGQLTVMMDAGLPRIFFPSNRMNGSQLCGFSNESTLRSGSTSGAASTSLTRTDVTSLLLAAAGVFLSAWIL